MYKLVKGGLGLEDELSIDATKMYELFTKLNPNTSPVEAGMYLLVEDKKAVDYVKLVTIAGSKGRTRLVLNCSSVRPSIDINNVYKALITKASDSHWDHGVIMSPEEFDEGVLRHYINRDQAMRDSNGTDLLVPGNVGIMKPIPLAVSLAVNT